MQEGFTDFTNFLSDGDLKFKNLKYANIKTKSVATTQFIFKFTFSSMFFNK